MTTKGMATRAMIIQGITRAAYLGQSQRWTTASGVAMQFETALTIGGESAMLRRKLGLKGKAIGPPFPGPGLGPDGELSLSSPRFRTRGSGGRPTITNPAAFAGESRRAVHHDEGG